jgi:long-chain fatty acid transport protein
VNVLKIGAAWRINDSWTLRAGYNHSDNPISPADVTFNILAPGVMKDHYTAGFTWATSQDSELTGALMIAPRQSVSGSSLFNGVLGAGAAGNETISMRETSLGLAWSHKF